MAFPDPQTLHLLSTQTNLLNFWEKFEDEDGETETKE